MRQTVRKEPDVFLTDMAGLAVLQCKQNVGKCLNIMKMTDKDIIHIAAMNGWKASVNEEPNGTKCASFRRYMRSEMPFVFTVEVNDGRAGSLAAEIISLEDAIDPEACAREWMVKSGIVSPSMFNLAVADMDGIRTEAWLLACAFLEFSGEKRLAIILSRNIYKMR